LKAMVGYRYYPHSQRCTLSTSLELRGQYIQGLVYF
jgi:hypothetical protein